MNKILRAAGPALVAGAILLSGCRSVERFLPRDETPVLPPAFAVEVPRGASGQRLDERGYPILGHRPRAAAPQAEAGTVSGTQARFADVEGRGSADAAGYQRTVGTLRSQAVQAQAAARDTQYQQTVEDLRALAAQQREATAGR